MRAFHLNLPTVGVIPQKKDDSILSNWFQIPIPSIPDAILDSLCSFDIVIAHSDVPQTVEPRTRATEPMTPGTSTTETANSTNSNSCTSESRSVNSTLTMSKGDVPIVSKGEVTIDDLDRKCAFGGGALHLCAELADWLLRAHLLRHPLRFQWKLIEFGFQVIDAVSSALSHSFTGTFFLL